LAVLPVSATGLPTFTPLTVPSRRQVFKGRSDGGGGDRLTVVVVVLGVTAVVVGGSTDVCDGVGCALDLDITGGVLRWPEGV
jgi:hypothetical protein